VKDIAHHADFIRISEVETLLEFISLKEEDVLV
jgi:hypothetical protein